jgi:hypothetical protein
MRHRLVWVLAVSYVCVFPPSIANAQQPAAPTADESTELAKKLSNPISDLVSVPFQFNWAQNVGPFELSQFILNVQPVIPFTLNKDWNMIVRVIAPFIGQPPLFVGGEPAFGMGDTTNSFFFSPSKTGSFTIGVGPVFVLPSTQDPTIGSGKWSGGPTVVALRQQGPWTYGVLWNQVWSFSGDSRREDVNQMFLQPFLAYQATRTITLTVQSETTANWEAEGTDTWTVPVNFLISKLSSFGTFPASYQLGYGFFPAHPDIGPTWKIRAAIVILLPRKKE